MPVESGFLGPSTVMITIDALRRDHMSLHGYGRQTTPHFDAMQGEMVLFDRAVATSPWTKPTTASLFTGLYPSGHGAHGSRRIRDDVPLLAEAFAAKGYRTAAFSGNPWVSRRYGLERGFQDFVFLGGAQAKAYRDIRVILERVSSWLDANSDRPFFLYLHVMNVHGPYRAPGAFKDRFVDGPTTPFAFQSELWMDIARRGRGERRSEVTDEHLRDISTHYDGAIAYTDSVLGEFVEELRERKLLDSSILIVTSDHGEEFFEHGSFGHRHALHAELLDVPLFIRLPGGRSGGRRIAEPVSLVDVPATLLDLVGLLDGQSAERSGAGSGFGFGAGRSLAPLFLGPGQTASPRPLLAELKDVREGTMVQLWPHRLIDMADEPVPRLYRGDEGVWKSVALAQAAPEVVEQLRATREALQAEAGGHAGAEIADPVDGALRLQLEALGYLEENN